MARAGLDKTIGQLTDAQITGLSDGDFLVYTGGKWQNKKVDLVDQTSFATSNAPSNGQVLGWNGSEMSWATPATGGDVAGNSTVVIKNADDTWPQRPNTTLAVLWMGAGPAPGEMTQADAWIETTTP